MATASAILSKCRHLTLTATDGKLEWIGTYRQWMDAQNEERELNNVKAQ